MRVGEVGGTCECVIVVYILVDNPKKNVSGTDTKVTRASDFF